MTDKKHPFEVGETYKRRDGDFAIFIGENPTCRTPLVFSHGTSMALRYHNLDGTVKTGSTAVPCDILPPEPPLVAHVYSFEKSGPDSKHRLLTSMNSRDTELTMSTIAIFDDGTRIRAVEVDGQRFEIEKGGA